MDTPENKMESQNDPNAGRNGSDSRMYSYGMGKGAAYGAAPAPGVYAEFAQTQASPVGGSGTSSAADQRAQIGYGMQGQPTQSQPQQQAQSGRVQSQAYPPQGYAQTHIQVPQQAKPPKRKRSAGFWVAIVIAVIAVIVAALLAFTMCGQTSRGARSGDLGQLDGKTQEEIQAELDRVVEEGMFNISIASTVQFDTGTSEGELRIENVPNNPYLMRVEIMRQDTGEKIYETDIIEPNHHIQSDSLDVNLPAGTYPCTAIFYALDPETEEDVGQAAANIVIQVME